MNVPIHRMKMSWRTTDNVEDRGVYLLRHLEVYMGEREGHWNCGLSNRNRGAIQYLRAKYCCALMLADNNHSSFFNKTTASIHYANDSKTMKIDVEKMIANYKASVLD